MMTAKSTGIRSEDSNGHISYANDGFSGDENAAVVELKHLDSVGTVAQDAGHSNGALHVKFENGVKNQTDVEELPKTKGTAQEAAENVTPVSTLALFKFADTKDKLFMIVGTLCSIVHGALFGIRMLLFGAVVDEFVRVQRMCGNLTDTTLSGTPPPCPSTVDAVSPYCAAFLGVGLFCWLLGYAQVSFVVEITFWSIAAERQIYKMKQRFFHAILYQDVAWFDKQSPGELSARLADDTAKIQRGMGDKIGTGLQWSAMALTCFIIGLVQGWKLSLVILAFSPLIMFSAQLQAKALVMVSSKEGAAYAKAGAVAEEVLSAIRTVAAFGGEQKEASRYYVRLKEALGAGIKRGALTGAGLGLIMLIFYNAEALGFWYGAKLVRENLVACCERCMVNVFHITNGVSCTSPANNLTYTATAYQAFVELCPCNDAEYTPGVMVTVFFCISIATYALGQAMPSVAELFGARSVARYFFDLVDRQIPIDASKSDGVTSTKDDLSHIEFDDVHFAYPTRPDIPILKGLTFSVYPGQTVALVGSSGCGKSTSIQLLQRFYDAAAGKILIGGHDIKDLNVAWLRKHIGVVSQEPILFDRTIAENIRMGKLDATQDEIEQAARDANAHGFISKLPLNYATVVGEGGAQLSGGQKQRIAIARAIVRNPKIMLLDEATSALDTESERIVQDALDKAMKGRTTITIAHRLSTIQNADKIFVLHAGEVVESGTHATLLKEEGLYYALVQAQKVADTTGADPNEVLEQVLENVPKLGPRKRTLSTLRSKTDRPEVQRGVSALSVISALSDQDKKKLPEGSMWRIAKLNSPEWFYIVFGCCAAIVNGAVQPVSSIVFADILDMFFLPLHRQEERASFYAWMLFCIAAAGLLSLFFQYFFFAISGERLTTRLRQQAFEAILRQEIAWFDDPDHSTGILITKLATDASAVQGATGSRLGSFLVAFGGIGIGFIIAMTFSWKHTLVMLTSVPPLLVGGFAQGRIMIGVVTAAKKGMLKSGKVAAEALDGFRTVVSLSREQMFYDSFVDKLKDPHKKELRNAHVSGIVYGFGQACQFATFSLAFYYGAILIDNRELTFNNMMRSMNVGMALSYAPDYTKAKVAAGQIFELIDRKPEIDSSSTEGTRLKSVNGEIQFRNTEFYYPNRPTVAVLQKLNLTIKPGQTVALVGASGCGKSTCVQLIERFYDPICGSVALEGTDIATLNISWLRQQLGLVSQEPVLFDRTIAENIAYGDNTRDVSMNEIIAAARKANIHEFIAALPAGYETRVGTRGGQLSGGQKQRVAIARALVRNPKILLLDEATSALDTESEKVVQEALDEAQKGRTSIVIAHRLSTIQNADCIVVLARGVVVESGTHSELMRQQGAYYALQMAQQARDY